MHLPYAHQKMSLEKRIVTVLERRKKKNDDLLKRKVARFSESSFAIGGDNHSSAVHAEALLIWRLRVSISCSTKASARGANTSRCLSKRANLFLNDAIPN